ncbi:glycoside hydrolase superfamily [Apodospora peruviana]|uniref:chitinase n=1 Tax=Apodospora peruviana TaxID=516989 RepID=A0AAE0MEQ4_9PEZI|nr:glycoside hydrolase superfamily [Apodospora peruviana]
MRTFSLLAASATAATASRFVVYYDQYHPNAQPSKNVTAGITHVIMAFANSSLFTTDPGGEYVPFKNVTEVREMFDTTTKVCMAIGGWGDTAGFRVGAASNSSRALFAKNVAATVDRLGYDCVDVDWEYPGGNGEDYMQIPNQDKAAEIEQFPLFLEAIKQAIGPAKELSIAVPGLRRDMASLNNNSSAPMIHETVDFVNIMAYDLMNRRDNVTSHHTSVDGALQAVDSYLSAGFPSDKLNLGFAMYAKWFTLANGTTCRHGKGCPTALLEAADGSDIGLSGAMTFEASNLAPVPSNLTTSIDGTCGAGTFSKCPDSQCCGQYGFCGFEPGHCGTGCQSGFGHCEGPSITDSFKKAIAHPRYAWPEGAAWFWDEQTNIFWSWETPELIHLKLAKVVSGRALGGVMAWSLAEDSNDWSHLRAMQHGLNNLTGSSYERFGPRTIRTGASGLRAALPRRGSWHVPVKDEA